MSTVLTSFVFGNTLTEEQNNFFQTYGVLQFKRFISTATVRSFISEINRIQEDFISPSILQQRPEKTYLLNVASTTAYQTVPYLNVYAATKAFVLSFTRGLRYELRKTNISISALSPGSTDTDFVNRARMGESVKKTATRVNMSPDEVARIAV